MKRIAVRHPHVDMGTAVMRTSLLNARAMHLTQVCLRSTVLSKAVFLHRFAYIVFFTFSSLITFCIAEWRQENYCKALGPTVHTLSILWKNSLFWGWMKNMIVASVDGNIELYLWTLHSSFFPPLFSLPFLFTFSFSPFFTRSPTVFSCHFTQSFVTWLEDKQCFEQSGDKWLS